MTATLAQSPSAATSPSATGRGPYRLSLALIACTLVLIVLGGMVTSTGSGMAFRDWPLANGSLWPEDMSLAGYFEHVHRVVGALVGLMILTLTIWVGVRERARTRLRWLTIGVLGLVVLQGVIGGYGVLWNLPALTSVTHGVLAQVTLCSMALVAFCLSPSFGASAAADAGQVRFARKAALTGMILVFTQLLIGAIARHTGNGPALWGHVGLALVVFLALLIAAAYALGKMRHVPGVELGSRLVVGLLVTQVTLGFVALLVRTGKDPANVQFLWRASLITCHVLVGALLFLAASLLTFRLFRNARPLESRE